MLFLELENQSHLSDLKRKAEQKQKNTRWLMEQAQSEKSYRKAEIRTSILNKLRDLSL